jgi:hypothetical protein
MAEEETYPNDILDQVFAESDPFRLAIRSMVLLEELVDDAIDEAFRDGLPAELARLSRPSRGASRSRSSARSASSSRRKRSIASGSPSSTSAKARTTGAYCAPKAVAIVRNLGHVRTSELRQIFVSIASLPAQRIERPGKARHGSEAHRCQS